MRWCKRRFKDQRSSANEMIRERVGKQTVPEEAQRLARVVRRKPKRQRHTPLQ